MNTLSEAEADECATAHSMMATGDYFASFPDDPRTYGVEETIAYLREQRERARSAFQARFDVADRPRDVSALQALHTGNWQGFFDSCCQPF